MSVKVSSWVWHSDETRDVTGNEMILLLALADVADDNGRCRFVNEEEGLTYDALAAKLRVDRRTIERLIPKLRDRGLVTHQRGVKGRPNEFALMVPWAKPIPDTLSGNGDADSPTLVQDSPTTVTGFPDNRGDLSSLKRKDVIDVESPAPETLGQRYAQPLCDVLSAELSKLQVKHSISKDWLTAARLLVDRDRRDPHEARALIEWALTDAFWLKNIHSMPKFREKYDRLRLDRGSPSRVSPSSRAQNVIEMGRRLQAGGQKAVGS